MSRPIANSSNLNTVRAWALKESLTAFFCHRYDRPARKHFRRWRGWAVHSRLAPMLEKARMLKPRFENVVTHLRHRITNAASESLNSKIGWVRYTTRSFRKRDNLIIAI